MTYFFKVSLMGGSFFAADADVEQVLFDVFQQAGVVVMLLQGLVHAGGFVAAQVAGYDYRIFVLMGIGQDFFKCLADSHLKCNFP